MSRAELIRGHRMLCRALLAASDERQVRVLSAALAAYPVPLRLKRSVMTWLRGTTH
jgi:hypothetical protein